MSISKYLQTSGILQNIVGMSPQRLEEQVISLGTAWYDRHPKERDIIASNLEAFGLDSSVEAVNGVIYNVLLHYFEKFLPLAGDIDFYADFLSKSIEGTTGVEDIRTSLAASRGICIATAHFGAVEFITPFLAMQHLPISAVLRFSTEEMSQQAHARSIAMERCGKFSLINLIEIGRPGTVAAMQMAASLRRGEIVLSVFDEKTPYSKPVNLFGKRVWGGAGLDKMIDFSGTDADLYAAFMVRRADRRYQLDLKKIDAPGDKRVDAIYLALQSTISRDPAQWYFLHEEIPFVEE